MFKKILLVLLLVLIVLGIYYRELVSYGYMQAKGQLHILFNTRPVSEVLQDPTLPDSLKQRLRLIGEIKQFAVDSLGLDSSGSYTEFFDQKGKPILWVITASEKFKLLPKTLALAKSKSCPIAIIIPPNKIQFLFPKNRSEINPPNIGVR